MLAVTPSMPANCNASWRTMALPVCAIVQFEPDPSKGNLAGGYPLPRDTPLFVTTRHGGTTLAPHIIEERGSGKTPSDHSGMGLPGMRKVYHRNPGELHHSS